MNNTLRELTENELQAVAGGGTWLQAAIAFIGGTVIGGPLLGLAAAAASLAFDEGPPPPN
jgi:bacteriocin-like protein